MTAIDPRDLDEITLDEGAFWSALAIAADALNVPPSLAARYRIQISNASAFERALALHDSPLDLAAALAGVPVTKSAEEQYDRALAEQRYPQAAFMEPRSEFRAQDVDQQGIHQVMVSVQELNRVLANLGYKRLTYAAPLVGVFEIDRRWRHRRLPPRLTISWPSYRTHNGSLAFDQDTIVDFFRKMYLEARARDVSEDYLRTIAREHRRYATGG
jgi:hypothetical protein